MKGDYRYKKSHYGGRKYEKLIGNYFPSLGILKITHYVWINNAYKGVATSLNSCENFSTRVRNVIECRQYLHDKLCFQITGEKRHHVPS